MARAWDCDPDFQPILETVDLDLDEEDDEGDWQVLVLDRFGDRLVDDSLEHHGDYTLERSW